MSGKILIPSEMLEPIITKTLAEILECFACGMWTFEEVNIRIKSLSHFVSNCGAIHCNLAITNFQNMLLNYEDRPEDLKKMAKEIMDKHYQG